MSRLYMFDKILLTSEKLVNSAGFKRSKLFLIEQVIHRAAFLREENHILKEKIL